MRWISYGREVIGFGRVQAGFIGTVSRMEGESSQINSIERKGKKIYIYI